ncbi:MAG: c-type cytochrome biogenesis protein CcsB [Mariprofundaceae bacterium]
MTAITATAPTEPLSGLLSGKTGFIRFWAYLGLITGLASLVYLGGDGYVEDNALLMMLSKQGAIWGGVGAVAGAILAFLMTTISPHAENSRAARAIVPWLDGTLLLLLLTALFSLFEPASIDYDDQSNLVSGKVIMAMNMLYLFAAILYIVHLFIPETFIGKLGSWSAWIATYAGGIGLTLRWHESYLIDMEIGHAPVSNLFEVFIVFFCVTSMIYLTLERRYGVRGLGAFVMPLVAGGVFFGIWLDSIGQADIKPLVPALQSYWMKIHVPMNFVGYGAFAVACGAGMMYLVRSRIEAKNANARILANFPSLVQLDQLAYKSVAIGFPAFTLATILGAAWAAEAWGGYWSWDPKETWALIVWLVYGAYLHARISHGWNGKSLAWWTVIGFLVTVFCFVGVNIYLSGLHSYGRLS